MLFFIVLRGMHLPAYWISPAIFQMILLQTLVFSTLLCSLLQALYCYKIVQNKIQFTPLIKHTGHLIIQTNLKT